MDDPKPCGTLTEIRDSASMDLYALFNSSILSVTEGTKVSSVIRAEYTAGGERLSQSFTVTLRVYGRNSLTWDDDRKAAAFVTAKDPTVLRFAKNSTALVSELAAGNMNKNLRKAIVLHEALALYGIRYEVVPASVFKTRKDSRAIDSLQFPKQTLEYKAGNCSDITILYSALLESVGIDTAFITVPGHIFMAFALDQDQDKDSVPRAADFPRAFFEKDGVAWVPVETTLVNDSFAKAWQEGAREWAQDGTGAFYPVRDAWQSFEPVDFNEQAASVAAPAHDQLAGRCAQSVDQVAAWQMALPESKLKQALARNPEDPALANKLAVLYARYGKYDMAVSTLGDVVKRADYLPAIINMGTASFMLKDFAKARDCYQKALLLQPNNAAALAQLSRACFELGDFQHSSNYFAQLKTLDASLADKYAYLAGEGGTRSAERDEAASWME
jgi:tetratricopeptide (TPR) repeat protein